MKAWTPTPLADQVPVRPLSDALGGGPAPASPTLREPWTREPDLALLARRSEAEQATRLADEARLRADEARDRFDASAAALDRMLADQRDFLVTDAIELGFAVAEVVLRFEPAARPGRWAATLLRALDELAPEGPVEIRLAPADATRLSTQDISSLDPTSDPTLEPGDFVVEDAAARIDGRIAPRLAAIREALATSEETSC